MTRKPTHTDKAQGKRAPVDQPGVAAGELEQGADPAAGGRDPSILRRRPTETIAGAALFATLYGYLTDAGLSHELAAVLALLVAFVPGAVSYVVDALRGA